MSSREHEKLQIALEQIDAYIFSGDPRHCFKLIKGYMDRWNRELASVEGDINDIRNQVVEFAKSLREKPYIFKKIFIDFENYKVLSDESWIKNFTDQFVEEIVDRLDSEKMFEIHQSYILPKEE